jgi:hypothetical protein
MIAFQSIEKNKAKFEISNPADTRTKKKSIIIFSSELIEYLTR